MKLANAQIAENFPGIIDSTGEESIQDGADPLVDSAAQQGGGSNASQPADSGFLPEIGEPVRIDEDRDERDPTARGSNDPPPGQAGGGQPPEPPKPQPEVKPVAVPKKGGRPKTDCPPETEYEMWTNMSKGQRAEYKRLSNLQAQSKDADDATLQNSMVARPVARKEVDASPKAQAAVLKEWEKLRIQGTWDEKGVKEWREVAQRVKNKGIKAHVGRIFEIVVEKGSELPSDHPARKFKRRVVYQGNNVRDEYGATAMFNELSSCPATMQAGKACDAFGLIAGHDIQLCDAEQAYIQADLGTTLRSADGSIQQVETWVRIPKNRQPKEWSKMIDPVVPLKKALYGHPDSGGVLGSALYETSTAGRISINIKLEQLLLPQ